jgi:hypothetical protein
LTIIEPLENQSEFPRTSDLFPLGDLEVGGKPYSNILNSEEEIKQADVVL